MRRILLAVDDSPAGVATARAAVQLAVECGAQLRAVHVVTDGELTQALANRPAAAQIQKGRGAGPKAVLHFVRELAEHAGVPVRTVLLEGHPARCVIQEAAAWSADVIVMGRSAQHHLGQPYIGSQAQYVMEFAESPVLVVPPRPRGGPTDAQRPGT
jgi:nucleotide-binding universal stress UspA family protein